MEVLLVREIFVGDHIGIISWVAFGELFVPQAVWNDESKADEQDDDDLRRSRINAVPKRPCRGLLTSAILDTMQTITPVV